MERNIKVIDETNGITAELKFEDEEEFIELWGMLLDGKPIIIAERKRNPYQKPPFAVLKSGFSS